MGVGHPSRGRSAGWPSRVVVVAVLAAVVWPVVRGHDSFPLSTYPMYAQRRGEVVAIAIAVGVQADGATRRLSLHTIADTDDPLIAESVLRRAISEGTAASLCRTIAGRAADGVSAVEIAEERHDVVAQATGEPSLRARTLHARCEVER